MLIINVVCLSKEMEMESQIVKEDLQTTHTHTGLRTGGEQDAMVQSQIEMGKYCGHVIALCGAKNM